MANKVTTEDIVKMNELYIQLHTYAAVARQTGFSASTVSKYIQKDYKPATERTFIRFTDSMFPQTVDTSIFNQVENYGELCNLSDAEKEEIKVLWEELDV